MSTLYGYILRYRMKKDNEARKKMNDKILKIKKKLCKIAKYKEYTRKEKYYFMKNLLNELEDAEKNILKLELERDIESLNRGVWVKDLMVFAVSGVSLLLNAISLYVKTTDKINAYFYNIVVIVYIIIAIYLIILGVWIPYLSRNLCNTQQILQILSDEYSKDNEK